MKKNKRWPLFLIPMAILSTGLLSYFANFHTGFSTNAQEWGSFGSFINPFVTLTNVVLFIFFSLLVFRYNNSINRPILTFKTDIKNGKEIWEIINVGNGPALNLKVSYKLGNDNNWKGPSVKCYSLGKNDKVGLNWLSGGINIIIVYYTDIFEEEYVAIVGNDITEIRQLSSYRTIKVGNITLKKIDIESFLELETIRITMARINAAAKGNSPTSTQQTTNPDG